MFGALLEELGESGLHTVACLSHLFLPSSPLVPFPIPVLRSWSSPEVRGTVSRVLGLQSLFPACLSPFSLKW